MPRTLPRLVLPLLIAAALGACAGPPAAQPPTVAPSEATPAPAESPSAAAIVLPTVPPAPSATAAPSATPEPTAEPSPTAVPPSPTPEPIVGALALPRGAAAERPFAVMIDNHPNAFPQTGLDQAAVVFEALAEYGLTRYMAVFVPGISGELGEIGPVRSARPYFVEWAKGLRAVYVHAGGSPEGLLLAETSVELINMDALRRDAGGFFRRSAARAAPHNLYTDSASLAGFRESKGGDTPELGEVGFLLKPEAPAEERPAAQRLSYFFLYREAYVGWSYDPASNSYGYFRQARPHVDARTGEQLRFKNVLVLEVPERPIPGDAKQRIEQDVLGEGRARVFRDGTLVEATWRKPAGFAPLQLFGPDGAELLMNPGNMWIAAIPSLDNLTVEGGSVAQP